MIALAAPGATSAQAAVTPNANGHVSAVTWTGANRCDKPGVFDLDSALVNNASAYTAIYQTDGNFVVYKNSGAVPLWSSNTKGLYNDELYLVGTDHGGDVFQGDIEVEQTPVIGVDWKNDEGGNNCTSFKLIMQTDGNLVEYGSGNVPL